MSATVFGLPCMVCLLPTLRRQRRAAAGHARSRLTPLAPHGGRFAQKNLMKCCKEFLLPDGKQIPFCAYNSPGYREQARAQLEARERARHRARRAGSEYLPAPLTFTFDQPYPQVVTKRPGGFKVGRG